MDFEQFRVTWNQPQTIGPLTFKCGRCGNQVGGSQGWFGTVAAQSGLQGRIYVCPVCTSPTFFYVAAITGSSDVRPLLQIPSPAYGEDVQSLPADVLSAYNEARACYKAAAYSAAVLMCRNLLMHIAVEKAGVPAGKSFAAYISDLESGGFIAAPNKPWVDRIRNLGNDATHDLPAISKEQAEMAIDFA